MEWVDDDGFDVNGAIINGNEITLITKSQIFNDNIVKEGAIVSGYNNIVLSGDGIIVSGSSNSVATDTQNISILSSSGVVIMPNARNISITTSTGITVLSEVSNVSITNSSGLTITESNLTYINGIKTLNNVTYKKYIALINQNGTNAPTDYVLENTLSSGITWSYIDIGQYQGKITNEFPEQKTWVIGGSADVNVGSGDFATLDIKRIDNDTIELRTYDNFNPLNSLLVNTSIEIRVYN